jgi:imidazolonepropionase-like amidohydrolase
MKVINGGTIMSKYALIHGNVLDGTEHMEVQKLTVLVKDEKIVDLIPEGEVPEGYEIIDLKGKYLMPGLINMHVHLAGNGRPQKKQRDSAKLVHLLMSNPVTRTIAKNMVRNYAKIEVMSGVTTIRTVGGISDYDTQIRDEIACGSCIGPRILAANQGISVPHGHMAGSVAVIANTPEEAASFVDLNADRHVDLIKLMITGGVMDAKAKGVPGELKMQPEMIKAACDEAHKKGFYVAAHVESTEGVRAALMNGVDSIEHGAAPDDDIIRLFKEKNAFLCTTLSPALPYALFDRSVSHATEVEQYNGNMVFEGIKACSVSALKNGIPVALGNDVGCPYVSQYDFWRELVYFHHFIGVSNQYALYTATLHNAQLAGVGNITGSIEKGKCADMIVTDSNPLDDLRTLRNVRMVMADGKLIRDPKVKRNAQVDHDLDPYLGTE